MFLCEKGLIPLEIRDCFLTISFFIGEKILLGSPWDRLVASILVVHFRMIWVFSSPSVNLGLGD